jgi:hypothetical protein
MVSSLTDLTALVIIPTQIINIRKKARNIPIRAPNRDAKKFLITGKFLSCNISKKPNRAGDLSFLLPAQKNGESYN